MNSSKEQDECEWYGRNMGQHETVQLPQYGIERCIKCKKEWPMEKEVKLPPIEDTFGLGAVPMADALRQRNEQLREYIAQIAILRDAFIRTGRNLGAYLTDEVSNEFICNGIPEEARLVVERLTAKAKLDSADASWARTNRPKLADCEDALRKAEAEISTLKDEAETMEELSKAKLPCGHHYGYAFTENGGKTGFCTLCELAILRDSATTMYELEYEAFDGSRKRSVVLHDSEQSARESIRDNSMVDVRIVETTRIVRERIIDATGGKQTQALTNLRAAFAESVIAKDRVESELTSLREKATGLARYVVDHPHAAFGTGDEPHRQRGEMQKMAKCILGTTGEKLDIIRGEK